MVRFNEKINELGSIQLEVNIESKWELVAIRILGFERLRFFEGVKMVYLMKVKDCPVFGLHLWYIYSWLFWHPMHHVSLNWVRIPSCRYIRRLIKQGQLINKCRVDWPGLSSILHWHYLSHVHLILYCGTSFEEICPSISSFGRIRGVGGVILASRKSGFLLLGWTR